MVKNIIACLLFVAFPNPLDAQIPLIVSEHAGYDRSREPVTLGVPFAKGELSAATPVRVVDPAGNPVDAQFQTMAVWDNGSIKWLKCDFQASVSANSTAQYQIEQNATHQPGTELQAIDSGSEIVVTTGPIRFIVNKTDFNLFEQFWLDLNEDRQYDNDEEIISSGSPGPVVTLSNLQFFASGQPPEIIEIEEAGPVKVVIKVSGRHYNGSDFLLKYETRIYAYAGQPFVKIRHTYANGLSTPNLGNTLDQSFNAAFDRYAIDLHLNLTGQKEVRFGQNNGTGFSFDLTGTSAHLIQEDRTDINVPMRYNIMQDANTMSSGTRAEGWGAISDDKWGLLISSRYFWQKYPKGLEFRDDGAVSFEPVPTPEELWIGMGTGDEVLLHFHPASEVDQASTTAMAVSKNPLFPRTAPARFAESKVFYNLLPGGDFSYQAMNNYIDETTSNHLENRDNLQLYGNLNFGDVPRGEFEVAAFMDESTWGNNYYDCILTTTRLFAQTGDPRYIGIFVPMAWHWMETACWNTYDPNDWMNGYTPSYGAYHREIDHFEQHYGEGIWYYYYLTGDERAREIGLRAANSIVFQQTWANDNTHNRMAYQRGSACLEAWKNTRDSTYLNLAKHLLVDKILATQDAFGLIGGSFEEGGFEVTSEQSFMMGLYSDALWKYILEVPTSDPGRQELVNKLALLADFFDTYARKEHGQEDYWNFWSIPNDQNPPQASEDPDNPDATVFWNGKGLMVGTYAYAYDLTGVDRYRTLAESLLDDIWFGGGAFGQEFWGKSSAQAMKNMLHAAAILDAFTTGIDTLRSSTVPASFSLSQNFPNPFNPATTIKYSLPSSGRVTLKVYDLLGREVAVLIDNQLKQAGDYTSIWDGRSSAGNIVASGVYLVRMQAGDFVQIRKMMFIQ